MVGFIYPIKSKFLSFQICDSAHLLSHYYCCYNYYFCFYLLLVVVVVLVLLLFSTCFVLLLFLIFIVFCNVKISLRLLIPSSSLSSF